MLQSSRKQSIETTAPDEGGSYREFFSGSRSGTRPARIDEPGWVERP